MSQFFSRLPSSVEIMDVDEKNRFFVIAGPCAIESEEQINDITYKISLIRDIAKPYRAHSI
jgi:3-deoxy-D-arabino-heptulosonate 7-phosphate (DAHP) synthase